jgi:hypothetical protein
MSLTLRFFSVTFFCFTFFIIFLQFPPKALPPCFLAWVKSLPENEKETLRKLRAETVRRHKEGLIPVDNNGKSIDEVFTVIFFLLENC